jgi:hypothetical protein
VRGIESRWRKSKMGLMEILFAGVGLGGIMSMLSGADEVC